MRINVFWRKPIYREEYVYAKRRTVRTTIEPCKKCIILSICIKGLPHLLAEDMLEQLLGNLGGAFKKENLLSRQEWGESATYEWQTMTYTESICIPRDFDNYKNADEQKKEIISTVRKQIDLMLKGLTCEMA